MPVLPRTRRPLHRATAILLAGGLLVGSIAGLGDVERADAGVLDGTGAAVSVRSIAIAKTTTTKARKATKAKRDVRETRGLYVDPSTVAATAAASDPRLRAISGKAQALWLTDAYPVSRVRAVTKEYVTRATTAKKTPVLAVYAIPNRDCGGYSSGGFSASTYRKWVSEIAKALKGASAIVVLEPDAVASLGDCSSSTSRARLLADATKKLSSAGAWVYLDAGHSGWRSAADIAARLKAAGIAKARGFSLNVGNYQRTATEAAYAKAVVAQLKARGVTKMHYVIETARNGAGSAVPAGQVCNPVAARIGTKPRMILTGALDAYLWVKHPGESDGQCNGGPSAGQWWQQGALALLGFSG